MAGALTEPVDGAIFIFRNASKTVSINLTRYFNLHYGDTFVFSVKCQVVLATVQEIEEFVQNDPYVVNGLVPSYTIRPYMVVAGDRD